MNEMKEDALVDKKLDENPTDQNSSALQENKNTEVIPDYQKMKQEANNFFKLQQYTEAEKRYDQIISNIDQISDKLLKSQIYNNKAQCVCKKDNFDVNVAIQYMDKAIEADQNKKYYHKRATLLMEQQKYALAHADLLKSDQTDGTVKIKTKQCLDLIKKQDPKPTQKQVPARPAEKPFFQYNFNNFYGSNFEQEDKDIVPEEKPFPGIPNLEGDFAVKLKEFIKYHVTLQQFLEQFHSSVIKEKFSSVELTVVEFQAVVWAILDSKWTVLKKLNTFFSLGQIKANQSLFMSVDEFCKKKMREFYDQCDKEKLNEIQSKRLETIKEMW